MTRAEEDHRKHLEFIQGVVTRLANNQFLIKGWCLTVDAALYGYAAAHEAWEVALVGIAVSAGFWGLDAYFLKQERLFRFLWVSAVSGEQSAFSLDIGPFLDKVSFLRRRTDENGRRRWAVLFSKPLVGLYGLTIGVGVVVAIGTATSASHRPPEQSPPAPAPAVSSPSPTTSAHPPAICHPPGRHPRVATRECGDERPSAVPPSPPR